MSEIFPTATEAKNLASDIMLIFVEITAIQTAVMTAIENKQFEATIINTVMTSTDKLSQDYFAVWQRTTTDKVKMEQMNRVISYFENNGYSIIRMINSTTGNTFKWYIEF